MPRTRREVRTRSWAHSDDHPSSTGSHQVKRRLIAGAAPYEHGHLETTDEMFEVEWLMSSGGNVFGGGDRCLNDQKVGLGSDDVG